MKSFDVNAHLANLHQHFPAAGRQPVVGVTGNYGEQTCKRGEEYYKQIVRAGGTPLIIPPLTDEATIQETLERVDALLLSGGADINPLFMGEEPQPRLGGICTERDLPELLITRLAFNRQLPILGICRGIQTLAVALGGKVVQDIASQPQSQSQLAQPPQSPQLSQPLLKHSQDADRATATHTVTLSDDSTLRGIFGCERLFVNSFHHQAVSTPGHRLKVTATAPDGIIEAVESTEHKPIIGVQWHPECMGDDGLPLFQWLVREAETFRKVKELHSRVLTLDTHCDTPMLFPQDIDFATRDDRLLVDLHKMTEGRLDATIMVAYLPQNGWPIVGNASERCSSTPKAYADAIFDRIAQIVADNSGYLALARTPADLWANKRSGRKSIMLGIENGLALEDDLDNLIHFKRRGVVYITLCHNGDNSLCDSAKPLGARTASSANGTWGGVSPFGADVIRRMNELGIIVDLSHAHERSFYDALDISRLPIVCSHSSARALCDHPRNLTDDQMRVLAKKGGVCQITLYPGFLSTQSAEANIMTAMTHLDHAIAVMGIDHVGLGTDFDGDGGVPGLADASDLTNFTRQLLARRYCEDDIQKIWGGNFLRVMEEVQANN